MMSKPSKSNTNDVDEGKVFAILAYLSIFCIIPLLFKKDNTFALYHGKQGLVIFLGQVALFLASILLGSWIFKLGGFILGVVSFLGIIAVLKGEEIKLPLITDIAEKITL